MILVRWGSTSMPQNGLKTHTQKNTEDNCVKIHSHNCDKRHCKHPQQPQSHSIELIFAFWINFGTRSTLRHTAIRISKKNCGLLSWFSFRQRLVPKSFKILAFLNEVNKVSLTLSLRFRFGGKSTVYQFGEQNEWNLGNILLHKKDVNQKHYQFLPSQTPTSIPSRFV